MAANTQLQAWISGIREKQRNVTQFLMGIPAVQLLIRTFQEMSEDDATHMAAGVAYYAMLSLFPLVLGVLTLMTLFFDHEVARATVLGFVQENLPGSENMVSQNIDTIYRLRGALGIVSFVGLFWTASAIFGAISRSINRAWDVKEGRPFYIAKARHLLMALSVAVLLGVSIAMGAILSIVAQAGEAVTQRVPFLGTAFFGAISILIPLVISFVVFALIYRLVPNTPVRWRDVWLGALVAAIGFEVAKIAFVFYLNNFANFEQVHGSLASIVVLLVWFFFSALILIIGAELSAEFARMRRGLERGTPLSGTSAGES